MTRVADHTPQQVPIPRLAGLDGKRRKEREKSSQSHVVGVGGLKGWLEGERRGEYAQNALHEILKELIKIF